MTAIDYSLRAGANPRPAGWTGPLPPVAHTHDQADELAASGQLFWADVAEFQPPIDDSYPYRIAGIRGDTGYRLDDHLTVNWAYCEKAERIAGVSVYLVFKAGQSGAILGRIKNQFGGVCPPKLRPEIDMESGADFAGPGNHSAEANDFIAALADWGGNHSRPGGYANAPDWGSLWPTAPPWLNRRLARFSDTIPDPGDYFEWQFYGGMAYPVPAGYPTSCAPFGSHVDLNVVLATSSLDTYLDDTGLDWLSMATEKQVRAVVRAEIIAAQQALYEGGEHTAPGGDTYGPKQNPRWARAAGHGVGARLGTVEADVAAIKAKG